MAGNTFAYEEDKSAEYRYVLSTIPNDQEKVLMSMHFNSYDSIICYSCAIHIYFETLENDIVDFLIDVPQCLFICLLIHQQAVMVCQCFY